MNFLLNGKTIYYEIHGEGDPLLMLNGIMMTTKSWAPFIEELSQHHQLILLDFIDQGQSGPAETAYKQDIQVDVIKALLDHLELESVLLFGISYGGEVALQFVSTYPENVENYCCSILVLKPTTG
ncbi:alpha/beta fold hydrolase [Fundicoccus ignavus]|uniref:alpha/beta fold hydrolase n=1 Tax=Fundicoccus ignavus TaxID=2664442 RepID=UPI001C12C01E|nr:alpha/beta hydrolase [Fundicoccus ignavus]